MKKLSLIFFAILVFAAAMSAQTNVRVTNKKGDAVAVKSVDNPARHAYQVSFALNTNLPTVPDGKVFAVEHISGHMRVPSAFGAVGPCKFMQLSFILGSADIDVIPVSMGTSPSLSNDVNFISFTQPVRAYVSANSDFGAANLALSQYCSGFPTDSTIVITGHLINAN